MLAPPNTLQLVPVTPEVVAIQSGRQVEPFVHLKEVSDLQLKMLSLHDVVLRCGVPEARMDLEIFVRKA